MKKSKRGVGPISGTEGKKSGCSNLGCALFALPFFLVGVFCLYFLSVGPALKIYNAKSWNPTPCVVTSSRVGTGGDGTYAVDIAYTYSVDGAQYQSDRYDFFGGYTSGYESKAEVVSQNPVGQNAICYVNPSNPADSVFHRELSSDVWFGLFGVPFLLAGAFGLFIAVRSALKRKKEAPEIKAKPASSWPGFDTVRYRNPSPTARNESDLQQTSFQPDSFQQSSFLPSSVQPASFQEQSVVEQPVETASASLIAPTTSSMTAPHFGRVTLQPQMSRGCRLGVLIGVTLFWNGIVSVFVWMMIKGFSEGNGEWFLALFLTPFVLVGIGLLFATAHSFLGLFNPRPTLNISSGQLHIGDEFDLDWEFSGSTRAINRLRVYLEGREEATYRRGTSTSTDKSVFAKVKIADTPTANQGRARVTIPANTMHSFESGNNKIVWEIHVVGDIRLWSDVDEAFPIAVLPKRLV